MAIERFSATIRERLQQIRRYPRRIAVTFGIIAALTAVVLLATVHAPQVALFVTPLDAQQLGEVDAHLAAWGIAHTLDHENMRVGAGERDDILLRLALNGLPHPHIASSGETLASVNALTPDALFAARARAGTAGDLALALRGVDGVLDAKVVLAPPVSEPFSDQPEHDAGAAVQLTLRPGSTLSNAAIAGIRAFVAQGVAGLQPEHVTIMDDRGYALGDEVAGTGDDAENIRQALQSAFDAAFGVRALIVRVRVRYDASVRRERHLTRSAAGAAVSDSVNSEHLRSRDRNYDQFEQRADHGTHIEEEIIDRPRGEMRSTAVAVFVDQARRLNLDQIREFAAATAGLDLLHGDRLTVQAIAFTHEPVAGSAQTGMLPVYGAVLTLAVTCAALTLSRVRGALHRGAGACTIWYERMRARKFLASLGVMPSAPATKQRHLPGEITPQRLYAALRNEPGYLIAAVLQHLPAVPAAAVLHEFSPAEREQLRLRMNRKTSNYLANWQQVLGLAGRDTA